MKQIELFMLSLYTEEFGFLTSDQALSYAADTEKIQNHFKKGVPQHIKLGNKVKRLMDYAELIEKVEIERAKNVSAS